VAADLKDASRASSTVPRCSGADLSNFVAFASPDRDLLFDLNDFNETLLDLCEYGVTRISASFTIASHNNGFSKTEARDVALASVSDCLKTMSRDAIRSL
jgi:uncharacterized protein (DUF2252 family)